MKTIFLYIFCLFSIIACSSCRKDENNPSPTPEDRDLTIVIIHDNDVHCGADGYVQFAGFRDAIAAADTACVATVSSGDFIQGDFIGGYSEGSYIIDIMKSVGYDAVTPGNHEFDYGIARQRELFAALGIERVTCSNFIGTNTGKSVYASYVIKKCGKKKIAFIGVLTPSVVSTEYYAFLDRDKNPLPYTVPDEETVGIVQTAVNNARSEGADYVILLSHLGENIDPDSKMYAIPLIQQTTGVDAVLDGHTHSVIRDSLISNSEGKTVLLTQTGTKFSHYGKITISTSGKFSSECIPDSLMKMFSSAAVQKTLDSVNTLCDKVKKEVVGQTTFELTINGEDGKRLVRKGETNLADLVCDAFVNAGKTRIAFTNGGSIRKSIQPGEITFGDVFSVLPFGNYLVDFEITGKQIAELLESGFHAYPSESGEFIQVAGLKYVYDQSHTPVIYDVQIISEDGKSYAPVSETATYTATTTDYVLNDVTHYPSLKGCKRIRESYMIEYNALKQYIIDIGGTIPERYRTSQERATINKILKNYEKHLQLQTFTSFQGEFQGRTLRCQGEQAPLLADHRHNRHRHYFPRGDNDCHRCHQGFRLGQFR